MYDSDFNLTPNFSLLHLAQEKLREKQAFVPAGGDPSAGGGDPAAGGDPAMGGAPPPAAAPPPPAGGAPAGGGAPMDATAGGIDPAIMQQITAAIAQSGGGAGGKGAAGGKKTEQLLLDSKINLLIKLLILVIKSLPNVQIPEDLLALFQPSPGDPASEAQAMHEVQHGAMMPSLGGAGMAPPPAPDAGAAPPGGAPPPPAGAPPMGDPSGGMPKAASIDELLGNYSDLAEYESVGTALRPYSSPSPGEFNMLDRVRRLVAAR